MARWSVVTVSRGAAGSGVTCSAPASRRRNRHPRGAAYPAGGARDQSDAAADDPRGTGRGRRRVRCGGGCGGGDLDPRRRGDRTSHPQRAGSASSAGCRSWGPPASWCRIPAPPGSIRSIAGSTVARAAGVRHIAGATGSTSELAVQRHHGLDDDRADRHGRFRGRHVEICARPSGGACDGGGRHRQDHQAGTGPAGPAFEARRRGSGGVGGDRRGAGRVRRGGGRDPRAPTPPRRRSRSRPAPGWPTGVAAMAREVALRRAGRSPRSRSRC